jgi:hypothetical protein
VLGHSSARQFRILNIILIASYGRLYNYSILGGVVKVCFALALNDIVAGTQANMAFHCRHTQTPGPCRDNER